MKNKFKDYGRRWGICRGDPCDRPILGEYKIRPYIFFFVLCIWPSVSIADTQCVAETRHVASLRGHARVEWIHKNKIFRYDEAIVIKNPNTASFETIDDFGNTLLKMDFLGDSLILMQMGSKQGAISEEKFKKIFSLPLSQSEFISYLLYKIPEGVENIEVDCDEKGRLVSVTKNTKIKKHRYKISFLDLSRKGRIAYPKTIEIVSKKTILRISWQNVKIQ